MSVTVTRVMLDNEHDNQKWIVLQGAVEGSPEATWKRATIAVSAYVARPAILDEARAKLIADVTEYDAHYLTLQALEG